MPNTDQQRSHADTRRASLHDAVVQYGPEKKIALDGFSMDVSARERIALIGPSGAGKTTVLNVLAGLVVPTSGTVRILGQDTSVGRDRAKRAVRRRVGMVHQHLSLVPSLRVHTNVAMGQVGTWSVPRSVRSLMHHGNTTQIASVLERLGIADKRLERTSSLSGGQQQRVALARVLYQTPDLLLADEPVSAVDPGWANEVLEQLTAEAEQRNAALVVSLHDPTLAQRWCTRIVGMRDGRILFDLPTADVERERIVALYELQRSALTV